MLLGLQLPIQWIHSGMNKNTETEKLILCHVHCLRPD